MIQPMRMFLCASLTGLMLWWTAALQAAAPVKLTYSSRDGRVVIPVRVNNSGPYRLLLDTGYELIMLNPQIPKALGLQPAGGVTIVGIAGEERADTFSGVAFNLGGAAFNPRRVASLPSDARRRDRDGILGSAFFRRFVVEIDSRAGSVRLHEPGEFKYSGRGTVLPLVFAGEVPVVEARLSVAKQPAITAQLKIDTGCDGGLCLGREIVERHNLAAIANGNGARNGVGGAARTRNATIEELQLGALNTTNVNAHLFSGKAPGDAASAGHLGIEALNRFRMIFDYTRRRLILEEYATQRRTP